MNQAKKEDQENPFTVEKNNRDKRSLEQRYSFAYKSAASSSARNANTSPLENFIDSIEKEERVQGSLLDTILYYAGNFLHQLGYTNQLIESRSKRKLKKTYASLQHQLQETDEQIASSQSSINQIDNYLAKHSMKLQEYQETIVQKKNELGVLKEQIVDYKDVTQNSLNPQEELVLNQAELDYQLQEQVIDDLKETCQTTYSMIEEYYAQKSQEYSLLSLFEGNKILLSSLSDKIDVALEKSEKKHPLAVLSGNKVQITKTYKVQDDLLAKDTWLTRLYNQKTARMPSYKDMSKELTKKRQSQPSVRR